MSRYHRAYASTQMETMTPTQILSALFKRLVRDLDEADAKIQAGDAGGKGHALNHAHSIVSELVKTLDHKRSPDYCKRLHELYMFVLREIGLANNKMSRNHVANAKKIVVDLQAGFDQAIESLSGISSSKVVAVAVAR